MDMARTVQSYVYIAVLAAVVSMLNLLTAGYSGSHEDSVIEVAYFIIAAFALTFVRVRLERGTLTLSALSAGTAAVLLNPMNATLVGLATGFAMARRQRWQLVANPVMSATLTVTAATVASVLRGSTSLPLSGRLIVLLVADIAGIALVAVGLSIRSGESIQSIARHNFTSLFLLAYGYFTLGSLLVSYLVDGSLLGYLLATIVFVLALALTDTIAGRRVRRVLESELSDADRHLFHSRAVEGVVHNLRNHLATTVGYLKEIDLHRLDPVDREAVATATAAANDAVAVLRGLAQGATPRVTFAPDPVDLNELASTSIGMARPRAKVKQIEVGLRESPEEVKVKADPLLLREVMTNLVNNAIDAAPAGGHVNVSTGRRGSGTAFFSVADDGPGVAEENRHRLFEPHFTTKESGTGLGLFMSYGVIREHQGQLLYTGSARGAVFTVTLPPFAG